jgi:hypothetical protein
MRFIAIILLVLAALAGCQRSMPPDTATTQESRRPRPPGRISKPVVLPTSGLLGLTEAGVLEKERLERLNPEPGAKDRKWFSGGIVQRPRVESGYIWERCHILTFRHGRVVRHMVVDRRTAHVSVAPRRRK